jgi:hypothetical protein
MTITTDSTLVTVDSVVVTSDNGVLPAYPFADISSLTADSVFYTADNLGANPPTNTGVWPAQPTITNLPVRGAWALPGGNSAIWVIGSGAFLMQVTGSASSAGAATFGLTRIGTLATNTGPVNIRDNGPGGLVVIVDGPNGYWYVFGSTGSAVGPVGTFTRITDPGFLGATHVAFIDGWLIFNQPNSQTFYTTLQYSATFPGAYYALKDSSTDQLVALYENKEELWLIGERTTEIWYSSGGAYFGFSRLVSTMLQVGCGAKHSVARFSAGGEDGLIWLAKSERGQNVVVRTRGFSAMLDSTQAINDTINSYPYTDDAVGYTYQADGHMFYVLTFPSVQNNTGGVGVTWVFDGATDMWHQRASFDPYTGTFNRHRSNCHLNLQGQHLVGDFQNGSIYKMARGIYTDAGWPLKAVRRTPHIWDGGSRGRLMISSLEVDFAPGVGNQTGQGVKPQAILRISRDAGKTFGNEYPAPLGQVGQYTNRTRWMRLGTFRDGVFEVSVIDPVNRDIVGATLHANLQYGAA